MFLAYLLLAAAALSLLPDPAAGQSRQSLAAALLRSRGYGYNYGYNSQPQVIYIRRPGKGQDQGQVENPPEEEYQPPPEQNQPSPEQNQPSPEQNQPSPEQNQPSPEQNQPSPQQNQPSPEQYQQSSSYETVITETSTVHRAPKKHKGKHKTNKKAHKKHKSEPKSQKKAPKPPKSKPKAPKRKPKAPKSEPKAPKSKPKAPKSKPKAPKSEPKAPKSEPKAPKSKPKAPEEPMEELNSLCEPEPKNKGDQCDFDQVVNITNSQGTVLCNAAVTSTKIYGAPKVTLVTSELCKSTIEQLANDPVAGVKTQLGGKDISLNSAKTVPAANGAALIDFPEGDPTLEGLSDCESPTCTFDPETMKGMVDLTECKMISYGSSSDNFKFEGKREMDMILKSEGCGNLPDLFEASNTMCFETMSGEDAFCSGDSGAPIYCKAPATSEWILIGVTATQISCGGTPEVKVIPAPQ